MAELQDAAATPRVVLAALWPCACYFLCSLCMNLLTKALVTTFSWRAVYALGAIQSLFTLASLATLALARCVFRGRRNDESRTTNAASTASTKGSTRMVYVLRVLLPLVALHVGNMLLGFASLRVVSLPMYLVLRRLTTLKVMLIEWLVLRKPISHPIKLALLVSTIGSLVAGSTDVMADLRGGYSLALLQNLCTALSLAFSKESALSPLQLVLLNSVAGAVVCSVLAWTLERDEVLRFPRLYDPQFLAGMLLMCSMCVLYQFSLHLCTLRTSALTTSVTGNIKDLFATAAGFLLFPDAPVRMTNLVGVALSFLGAYSFSYIRYQALLASPASSHPKQL